MVHCVAELVDFLCFLLDRIEYFVHLLELFKLHLLLLEIVCPNLFLPLNEDHLFLLLSLCHLAFDAYLELVDVAFIPVGCLLCRSFVELVVVVHSAVFLTENVSIDVMVIDLMLLLLLLEVVMSS